MKKTLLIYLFFIFSFNLSGQTDSRKEIKIPDVLGYKTLKCDFHLHTVFSDGDVWPTTRIEEAWREGLDAIALTDHLEYQPKKKYIPTDHNAPATIAQSASDKFGVLLIKGAEITRKMPPGHLNAIFIKDANALVMDDWKSVVAEVKKQGGFIFWNHPWWIGQQPDGIARWYDEHSYLLDNNFLGGIEIANGPENSMATYKWSLDKNLAIVGNSDNHYPIGMDYRLDHGEHRTMTLVFAKEKTSGSILEALKNRRTAVYQGNNIYGDEIFLREIFAASITVHKSEIVTSGRQSVFIPVTNASDINYILNLEKGNHQIDFPKEITLPAGRTILVSARAIKDDIDIDEKIDVEYSIKNLIVAPEKYLKHSFMFGTKISPLKK
jgi:3',5'-nucleoside bisphosphate phosphatase